FHVTGVQTCALPISRQRPNGGRLSLVSDCSDRNRKCYCHGCSSRATLVPGRVRRSSQSETVADRFRRGYCASAHPAQHDNLVTSLSNASAASFSPSTVLRYGKIMSARSSTVRL